VVVEVPARRAPRASATLALYDRRRNHPVTMTGISSSTGLAVTSAEDRSRRAAFAIALQRDAREAARNEGQVVEGGPGARRNVPKPRMR